jgi:tape measure domain-containing protein
MSGSTSDVGRLLVRIEATTAQLRGQLANAERQIDGFSKKADQQLSRFDQAWGKVGGGAVKAGIAAAAAAVSFGAVTSAISGMVRAADQANQAANRLGASFGNMAAGREVFDQIARSAQRTGSNANEAAASFQRFDMAARAIGATRAQTLQLVETLQKLTVISGGGAGAQAAIFQFAQGLGAGRLQAEELNSILEGMPTLAEGLARELGVSVGALRQMGSEGKLTSDVVFPAILRLSQQVNAQFASMPAGIERATGSLSQAWSNLITQLDRATGLSERIARSLQGTADGIQRLADGLVPRAAAEQLREVRAELEQIARIEAERGQAALRNQGPRNAIRPGAVASAAAQTGGEAARVVVLRELETQLDEIARKEAVLAAQRRMAEEAAAAVAAAETQRQRVLDQLRGAQEALGATNDKTRQQMDALRTVVAAGAEALARYGVSAETAASMLAALETRADSVRGTIAALNVQAAQAGGGIAARLDAALRQAAANVGGDVTRLTPEQVTEVTAAVQQLGEAQAAVTLQNAQAEAALARVRATRGDQAARLAQVEREVTRFVEEGGSAAQAAALRTALLSRAQSDAATSGGRSSSQRVDQTRRVTEALASEEDRLRRLVEAQGQGEIALAALNVQLEVEKQLRDAGIPAVERRTQAERDAAEAIERSVRATTDLRGQQERSAEAAREASQAVQRQLQEVQRVAERVSDDIATVLFESITNGGRGESVIDWFKALFRRIAIEAIKAQVVLPIVTQIVGSAPGVFGVAGGSAAAAGGAGGAGFNLGTLQSVGSLGRSVFSGGGSVTTGIGGIDSLLATSIYSSGGGFFGAGSVAATPLTSTSISALPAMSSATTGVGSVTIGGALGAVGAGYAAGALTSSLVGGARGTVGPSGEIGAATGAVAGAIIGSVIPVIGTFVGALIGGALGGAGGAMFGPTRGGMASRSGGDVFYGAGPDGQLGVTYAAGKRWDADASVQAVEQQLGVINQEASARGLRFSSSANGFLDAIGAVGFGQASGSPDTIDNARLAQLLISDNATVQRALDSLKARNASLEEMLGSVDWVQQVYEPMMRTADAASELQRALDQTNNSYNAAIETARNLGLAEEELIRKRDQATADLLRVARDGYDSAMREATGLGLVNQVLAIQAAVDAQAGNYRTAGRDPDALLSAQLQALFSGQSGDVIARTVEALREMGSSAASFAETAERAAQAQLQAAIAQEQAARAAEEMFRLGQNIRSYVDGLRTGTAAGFSPADRLTAAQGQFADLLTLARAGDAGALGGITQAADALLAAARDMFASGSEFAALRDMTISSLENLPATRMFDESIAGTIAAAGPDTAAAEFRAYRAQSADETATLRDELIAIQAELSEVRDELRIARLRAA